MKGTHTPGPWSSHPNCKEGKGTASWSIISDDSFATIAIVYKESIPSQQESNAKLLAAAPELLSALDYLLLHTVDDNLKHGIGLTENEEEARQRALDAIAKAKGEEA